MVMVMRVPIPMVRRRTAAIPKGWRSAAAANNNEG